MDTLYGVYPYSMGLSEVLSMELDMASNCSLAADIITKPIRWLRPALIQKTVHPYIAQEILRRWREDVEVEHGISPDEVSLEDLANGCVDGISDYMDWFWVIWATNCDMLEDIAEDPWCDPLQLARTLAAMPDQHYVLLVDENMGRVMVLRSPEMSRGPYDFSDFLPGAHPSEKALAEDDGKPYFSLPHKWLADACEADDEYEEVLRDWAD